jgi:hypothetical protein
MGVLIKYDHIELIYLPQSVVTYIFYMHPVYITCMSDYTRGFELLIGLHELYNIQLVTIYLSAYGCIVICWTLAAFSVY